MNRELLVFFILGFIFTLVKDVPKTKHRSLPEKALLYAVLSMTLGLFLCQLFKIELPMPTQFYVYTIARWFKEFVDVMHVRPL
jgi:hypothetical protein